MAQILVDNRIMKPTQEKEGGPSKGWSKRLKDLPQGGQNRKQCECRTNLESQSDSKSIAPTAQRATVAPVKIIILAKSIPYMARLKWFDKLPVGSIESFHRLIESFVTQFVKNTKALKGVGYLLTLQKGKNESFHNYKQYWEIYNEIKEGSEELAVDDVRQVERAIGTTPRGKAPFKTQKDSSSDYEGRVRQGINVVFKKTDLQAPHVDSRQVIHQETYPYGR
ncbi:hypothetical protein Acr_25g0002370 [Actinidia rufa]|uniref:Uncharacterized protein n=1 Tax=Actinidia rufa TaxID=165716 RepID=A0A7J0GYL8_9ERIC|nr:hypothetical protein Acr_25g0002370 [Actinidia rufa]